MTTRSTRGVLPFAIACACLAVAGFSAVSPARAAPPAAAGAPASAPAEPVTAAGSPATQYSVKPGQSLADIAASVTQSHDKAVLVRAARAIFDANPSAFMRGDPSLLKLGATLNVPPLDATGAVVKAEPASPLASASAGASNAAAAGSAGVAAAQGAAPAAKANVAQTAKPASAQAAGLSPGPASAAAGASEPGNALAPAPAVAGASHTAAPVASRAQPSAPVGASGGHAWAGAIQQAPAEPASATAEAGASGASAASSVAPAANATSSEGASGAAATAAGAAASVPRAAKPASASATAASAEAASHPKVSSLQQLLSLKNRVLMELQRHGFGARSANPASAATGSAPAGASAFSAQSAPSAGASAAATGQSRAAAAANQRFIGVGGYGVSIARADIPAVAAVVAAIVAALLVLVVALGISRRRQSAPPPAPASGGGSAGRFAARGGEPPQPAASAAMSTADPIEAEFLATLARTPSSKRALMGLAAHYAERKDVCGFDEIAQRIYRLSGGRGPNWVHIASVGRQLDPDNPLFASKADETDQTVATDDVEAGVPNMSESEAIPVITPPDEGVPAARTTVEPVTEAAPQATSAGRALPSVEMQSTVRTPPVEAPMPSEQMVPSAEAISPIEIPPEREAHAPDEVAPPEAGETPAFEAEWGETPFPEAREQAVPDREGMLPPEAIAALDGLDMGLPPRVEPNADSAALPGEQAPEREHAASASASAAQPEAREEAVRHAESDHGIDPAAHRGEQDEAHGHARDHDDERDRDEEPDHEPPRLAPSVSGLGAAPIGPLALSFDLDLPGDAHRREDAPAASAPMPQFTPEQLARIARNKLDLAGEYVALGDLGGARTLIHEVIESNDAATHDEAQALLATLAPLS